MAFDDSGENFKAYLQKMLPFVSSVVFLFCSYLPFDLLPIKTIHPELIFVCIYFWMIHRPDLFGLLSVFFLGLIDDLISNVPMGTNVFAVLILFAFLSNLLRFFNGKSFVITWYGFMFVAFVAFFSKWFILSVYYSQFLPLGMVCFSFLYSVAIYPFLSLVLAFVQNKMIADEE